MDYYIQNAAEVIDSESEIYFETRSSFAYVKYPHYHDFYELSLIVEGSQLYVCNGEKQILRKGTLIITRPKDIHSKEYIDTGRHFTIAFPENTINQLFNYLGEGFSKDRLLGPKFSPFVILSNIERKLLINSLEELHFINIREKKKMGTKLRILLLDLLARYFIDNPEIQNEMPFWLRNLLLEMNKRDNFISGVSSLKRISGKSHEYLCRIMKKYFDLTPTEYINELKLNYAVNLLLHTDRDIISISLEAGFENLSHFYNIFKRKYAATPSNYRKQNSMKPKFISVSDLEK